MPILDFSLAFLEFLNERNPQGVLHVTHEYVAAKQFPIGRSWLKDCLTQFGKLIAIRV